MDGKKKTLWYAVGPDEIVLGNVNAEIVDEGTTMLTIKFDIGGYGLDFAQFVQWVERKVDEIIGDAEIGFILKRFDMDSDRMSWNMQDKIRAEYNVSILGKENKRKVIERFMALL